MQCGLISGIKICSKAAKSERIVISRRHPFSMVAYFRRFASRDKISHFFLSLHLLEVILWCWNCLKWSQEIWSKNVIFKYKNSVPHLLVAFTSGDIMSILCCFSSHRFETDRKYWYFNFGRENLILCYVGLGFWGRVKESIIRHVLWHILGHW